MRIIALIFLLSLGYYGYSQGNKFMSRLYGNQYYYEFHEDNTLSKYFLTSSASNIESIFYNSAICDYNGTPLYLDLGHSIYGFKSGEKVKASDSLVGGTTSNLILRVGDTTFHSIHCWNLDNSLEPKIKASYKAYSKPFDDVLTFGGGIYVNELNADGIIKYRNKKVLSTNTNIYILNCIRKSDYTYLLLITNLDYPSTLFIYEYTQYGLVFRSMVYFPPNKYIQEPFYWPSNDLSMKYVINSATLTLKNDKLIISRSAIASSVFLRKSVYKYSIIEIHDLTLNLEPNGFVEMVALSEDWERGLKPKSQFDIYSSESGYGRQLILSTNDSILYWVENRIIFDSSTTPMVEYTYQVKCKNIRAVGQTAQVIPVASSICSFSRDRKSVHGLFLSPYGKITFIIDDKMQNRFEFNVIINSNSPTNHITKQSYFDYLGWTLMVPNQSVYGYLNIKHKINYQCDATVKFINKSDLSIPFNKYVWYIKGENGSEDTLYGDSVSIKYATNGKYRYMLHAFSEDLSYSEWFADTITIDIPEKPVPLFEVGDSIICKYSQVYFSNLSYSKILNPDSSEFFIWDFGDGTILESNSKNSISHRYTETGKFDVSLYYYNGYCDSSILLRELVRVIDAPTPGFNLDTVSGCAPLSIIISDTLRYGLTKKEYYFEDKNKWLDVNLDSLSLNYIFTKAGAFKVIQRLTGVTGCVVQHDSTIVTVHESIDNYGPVMSYGSYQTNEAIELRWTELFGAVNYSVYRSYNSSVPILITNTPLTRYVDTVSNPDYYKYFVQANDECGNISRQSAQLYPIFLQGIVAGENYYAQLEFTKYEIGIVEIEYEIAALVDLNWEIIAHTSDTTFRDYEFLNHGDSACKYRVSCLYDGQEAFSNILTLYQIPTVYIPTAFSPNNDGMNDNFKLVSTGISDYHVLVYNRWGQRVYEFSKGDNWDANNTNPGVYLVVVQATTFDQQRLYFSSTVTVLR